MYYSTEVGSAPSLVNTAGQRKSFGGRRQRALSDGRPFNRGQEAAEIVRICGMAIGFDTKNRSALDRD
jgi:hypothetical protein